MWEPRASAAQLTEGFPANYFGMPSAASMAIGHADMVYSAMGQPFSALLPAAILEVVRAEPSGAVGLSYRRYITTTLLPAVRRVSLVLQNHGAILEVRTAPLS